MSTNPPIRYSHNHHLLVVKGCEAEPDVLAFVGDEALTRPRTGKRTTMPIII